MAVIKCKMCGGDIEIAPDKTFGTCEYCGSTMTFPKLDDDQRAAAFNRGNHFRRQGEFDKALAVYERIVAEDDNDAEAHWCCALCRFGIEYVEDPTTFEYIPTCHRASFDSILEDVDYLAAVEHSDGITRRQYQKEAAKIAEVQRGILATSQKEEPFDVFICYKETDAETGERSRDSIDAQEVYYQLTEKGYRVFFARVTLEDKAGAEYEPYIFAALNSAKVMIVLGEKPAHFSAVWVKNEWSRYLSLMKKDRSRLLLPCYKNMDPYDLPEQLAVLQSYDMGKIGFIQDLIRGVEKVLKKDEPKAAPVAQQVMQSAGGANLIAQLKRGQQALEDRDWAAADGFFDKALDIDAECAEAFFGKALAAAQCVNGEALVRARLMAPATDSETLYACDRNTQHIEQLVKQYVVPGYFDEERAKDLFAYDKRTFQSRTKAWNARIRQEKTYWDQDRQLSRAVRYAKGELAETLKSLRERVDAALQKSLSESETTDANAKAEALERYQSAMEQAEEKAKQLHDEAVKHRQEDYESACEAQQTAVTDEDFDKVASRFETIGLKEYEDCKIRARRCRDEAVRLRAEARKKSAEEAERKRMEREKTEAAEKAKKKRIGIIAAAAAVVVIAIIIIITAVIIPGNRYKQAEELLSAGDYYGAIEAFTKLGSFKDSSLRVDEAHFLRARAFAKAKRYEDAVLEMELLSDKDQEIKNRYFYQMAEVMREEGQNAYAAIIFGKVADYQDARERSFALWDMVADRKTIALSETVAAAIKNDGTVYWVGGDEPKALECMKEWTDIVDICAPSGEVDYIYALRADGTVLTTDEQCREETDSWTDIVAIDVDRFATYDGHLVGLKMDGTVIAVGDNKNGAIDVQNWDYIIAVSAGRRHTIGLKADGTVVSTEFKESSYTVSGQTTTIKSDGQTNVATWNNVIRIQTAEEASFAVCADGTICATGMGIGASTTSVTKNWNDIVSVGGHSNKWDYVTIGVHSDGTVSLAGDGAKYYEDILSWNDISEIVVAGTQAIGLKKDGTVIYHYVAKWDKLLDVSDWTDIRVLNR